MSLTTNQDIALRLLEVVLILIPIWLAATRYIFKNIQAVESPISERFLVYFVTGYIFVCYAIFVASIIALRNVLSTDIESANILMTIDLMILFVVVTVAAVIIIPFELYYDYLEMGLGIADRYPNDDAGTGKGMRDTFKLILSEIDWFFIVLVISVILFIYWLLVGSWIANMIGDLLEWIYQDR